MAGVSAGASLPSPSDCSTPVDDAALSVAAWGACCTVVGAGSWPRVASHAPPAPATRETDATMPMAALLISMIGELLSRAREQGLCPANCSHSGRILPIQVARPDLQRGRVPRSGLRRGPGAALDPITRNPPASIGRRYGCV